MNLSLLEGLLAGLQTNEFSPSLEIEPRRCCVVLRPHSAQTESGPACAFSPQPERRNVVARRR
jgi:hypothetical protein